MEQIRETDDTAIAKALIKILDIETDEGIIEQSIYALTYKKEYKVRLVQYEAQEYKANQIAQDYYVGYVP